MNPPQMPAYPQTLGDLVVAASKSILQNNDPAQASSTEDTIAEDMSDASQNTIDGVADANTSTTMAQFAPLSTLKTPLEVPHLLAHSTTSCNVTHPQHKNGVNTFGNEDGINRKKDHKKRSKNWSALETLKLIRARAELDERFRNSGRKAALWEEIAQALQRADVCRDGQQCKDKWEKLTAGYKEVREGARDKDDLQFYKEIHQILSCKQERKENGLSDDGTEANKGGKAELGNGHTTPNWTGGGPYALVHEVNTHNEECSYSKKRKRDSECLSSTDISIVRELLETILNTQQQLFKDLLDAVEKKERAREQIRQEREEMWRAEERAQRYTFNNTMVILTQRLLGERPLGVATPIPAPTVLTPMVSPLNGFGSSKKRSKNWKRTEVFQLIRFRKDMEMKFAQSSRRAGLWEEVGEKLVSLGIKRDGKQCREKWDKLMAGYKDVVDGRRDKDESPYYKELSIYMEMIKEVKNSVLPETSKEEYVES